jgi:hypothetical protein
VYDCPRLDTRDGVGESATKWLQGYTDRSELCTCTHSRLRRRARQQPVISLITLDRRATPPEPTGLARVVTRDVITTSQVQCNATYFCTFLQEGCVDASMRRFVDSSVRRSKSSRRLRGVTDRRRRSEANRKHSFGQIVATDLASGTRDQVATLGLFALRICTVIRINHDHGCPNPLSARPTTINNSPT